MSIFPSRERILITGGAGFLGRALIKKLNSDNDLVIFSRDESKHYYLKKEYPNISFIVGDIRNKELLNKAAKGCTIGIYAASMKQIEAVDQNVSEAVQTIIMGALNSREVTLENRMKKGIFISSDKSRAATTLYGSMKFVAGESFIVNADKYLDTKLTSVIYGNVLNSTGSIIPLIWDSINNNYKLQLYGEEMTRFIITPDEAINAIFIDSTKTGCNIIPNLKSCKIKDLFDIYSSEFGLEYTIGEPRISEKLHEIMISPEEVNRTFLNNSGNYIMHHKITVTPTWRVKFINNCFSSEDVVMPKEQLHALLSQNNFFKPVNHKINVS